MNVIDTQDFQKDVIEKSYSIPVVVDFWAEWCGPCKLLGPVLERLAVKYSDRFILVKLNTDKYQDIAGRFGIRSIPNVKLFIDGKPAAEFTGALPEPHVEEWIKKYIPGKNEKLLSSTKELIYTGREEEAYSLLEKLKMEEPENKEADILLSRILLLKDPERALSYVKEASEYSNNFDLISSIETIADLLIREKISEFPQGEIKSDYITAAKYLKERNFDKALEKFIEIIRIDRNYDNDGARKACIAIFKYLGEDHPLTQKHRRDFGSALYV